LIVLTSSIRFRVNLLGAVALLAYVSLALLSYPQAAALWRHRPRAAAFFDALATPLPAIGLGRTIESNSLVLISYFLPLTLAAGAAVALVAVLTRAEHALEASLVRLLLRWSLAFAAACLVSCPVFTQDLWLSAVWGRMVVGGMNPYHTLFTGETVGALPLDHFPMAMSYGPAWAVLSGAVMLVAGKSVLAAAVLFKLVLAAAWVGVLVLVTKLTELRPVLDRCLAIGLVGWIPLGVTQTVAEGHNDVAMVLPALLWMLLALRGSWAAPSALAVSALAKYTTAPLLVVDAVAARRMHGLSWPLVGLRYVLPGLVALAAFAAFYRSPEFFNGTKLISQWHFLQLRDAAAVVEVALGMSLFPAEYLITAACAGFALYRLAVFAGEPKPDHMAKAALAVMCAVSFAAIPHLWPWYVVWILALAALAPRWWLSRFVVGLSLLAPFTLVFWWVQQLTEAMDWAAAGLYGGALLWAFLTRATVAGRQTCTA
jgi:alpha-1,6-mannosyltransferase